MSSASIVQALSQGATDVDGWRVKISQHQNRYIAYLEGPQYNSVVECPREISPEGIISFYERIASFISFRINQ